MRLIVVVVTIIMLFILFGDIQETAASERKEAFVTVDGLKRSFIVHYPKNTKSKEYYPIIMVFHPAFGTGRGMEEISKIHLQDMAQDYIVIYPDGIGRTWNAGDCCGQAKKRNINDLKFFDAILKDLQKQINIKQKVFVTGYSNGAKFVYHLMCNRSDQIAAAAPFGATQEIAECNIKKPIPLMHIHGDSDKSSPHKGGYAQGSDWKRSWDICIPSPRVQMRLPG